MYKQCKYTDIDTPYQSSLTTANIGKNHSIQISGNHIKSVNITWIINIFKYYCVPGFLMNWPFRNLRCLLISVEDASCHYLGKWSLAGRNKACLKNIFMQHKKNFPTQCGSSCTWKMYLWFEYIVWNPKAKPLFPTSLLKRKSSPASPGVCLAVNW